MSNFELIKKIREITGAGMSDVKKAIDQAGGSEEKAIEILRKAGSKIAGKKADRETHEGVIALAKDEGKLVLVALHCETDFVARNENFRAAADQLAQKLLKDGEKDFASWAQDKIQNELIVQIGENLQLGKFEIIDGNILGVYLHSNKKVAAAVVLVEGSFDLANELAMQVAAMAPQYLQPEDVPAEVVQKEKEIYAEQLKIEGKPENMMEQILKGKLEKFYTEVCLVRQPFIKEDKKSVEQLLTENKATIEKFVYYAL
ncbi:MAG: elongation factor Ts [Candidatus Komeilibacteria bacterium CG11_big_fil_rev_8_21_14_0_20_36_20]|uniref:Elongation factor Ts n=1 Tax=Candidatus Komeilibacteria bacterium CG11_big_fil_rev_8_21_14_0_20_36_20 TaxID=1974477 RepID=A0A2H0NAY2_9BACT|nr:MAG: elongation factor Ts [Candidatus Komeilibacteria bacterium CG11_big_fil_rev_8_21_14_0_20_36_20]PIR82059.1 MAG: elongation factor Ts [Candidatus Komeilibacteria bacterium CG10_big_fil_rev_8_21_14_0_10_36_65]PJC55038.1 MAG: elongation factor Ts [Candidatus Komeilibacteria bacterium CG_4_9_14_0_2_um_filter_36_13]